MAEEQRPPERREPPHDPYRAYGPPVPDDEISLFDLWDVLVRRRWVIVGVAVAVTVLALGYALAQPDVYRYSQVIEIGERMTGDGPEPIEAPGRTAAKLNERYIPAAVRVWATERSDASWRPQASASARGDAGIVVVEGEATAARADAMRTVFARATAALRDDQERVLASIREEMELEVARARDAVESLQADIRRVEGRVDRLDEREEFLRADIDQLEEALQSARERRRALSEDMGSGADPIPLMILTNDIQNTRQRLRQRLGELRRELRLELPDQRDEHQLRLAELEREIEARQASVRAAEARLDDVTHTRVASEPQRSMEPTGTSTRLIGTLGLVLGVMLGVFAAFFAEFIVAARRRHQEGSEGGEAA